ncbi:MAG: DUF3445 domain-containing protein [Pseudomonadota bacterium]
MGALDAVIVQQSIPYPVASRALPGMAPLAADGWIICDDAFAGQMALRDQLILDQPLTVVGFADPNVLATREVLEQVLDIIADRPGYTVTKTSATRPDGVNVPLSGHPLMTAARLIQEDLLIHERRDGEWTLTAGVLCFPASWTLAEKMGRGLMRIHAPVPEYDANIARRVARLFDGLQPGRPLWRHNVLTYADPSLYHPRTEASPRDGDHDGAFTRSEHQALVRLPKSRAVLFAIHTYVVASGD